MSHRFEHMDLTKLSEYYDEVESNVSEPVDSDYSFESIHQVKKKRRKDDSGK